MNNTCFMRGCFGKPGENCDAISISLESIFLTSVVFLNMAAFAQHQPADSTKNKKISNLIAQNKPTLEIFGFILTDVIYDFKQMDPQWYDGWTTTDPRIQFSFRFNFSQKFYHELNTTP